MAHAAVLSLQNLLEDIAAWGWAETPTGRLVFAADVPKLDRALPRALAPDIDARLMAAVVELPDPFARAGLQVLRGTGRRVGELLDLELGAVVDYGPARTWLRVPPGGLATLQDCVSRRHHSSCGCSSADTSWAGEQAPPCHGPRHGSCDTGR